MSAGCAVQYTSRLCNFEPFFCLRFRHDGSAGKLIRRPAGVPGKGSVRSEWEGLPAGATHPLTGNAYHNIIGLDSINGAAE